MDRIKISKASERGGRRGVRTATERFLYSVLSLSLSVSVHFSGLYMYIYEGEDGF